MTKILIVEDDEKLRQELKSILNKNGYFAETLSVFDNVAEDIAAAMPDLVLLDINLPSADGKYICKKIRESSEVPIIIVTSRDSDIDELICLNCGADQYVTKPYNIHILLAKITRLIKRNNSGAFCDKIDCGGFILNISQSCIERNERKTELTKNEFKILHFLALNRGRIASRDEIMDYLWETQSFIDDNTLTVNVKRLRAKLTELELYNIIQTKRGQGYILT